jgi:hypothetical protein
MSRTTRSSKGAKVSSRSWAVKTATPIRSKQAQERFANTAKKLGASSKVIEAAQKG